MGMREYETICILKHDLPDEATDRVFGKVEKTVQDYHGVLMIKESWGKKKLAYNIAKSGRGHYVFFHFLGGGGLVHEVERLLKIDDAVVRYMTVKVDEDVEPEARMKALAERPRQAPDLGDDDDMPGGRGDRRDRFSGRGMRDRDRGHDRDRDRDLGDMDDEDMEEE